MTVTSTRLKLVLGCLQEFNLLREAVLPVITVPPTRGAQPVGFARSGHSLRIIKSINRCPNSAC